jgi:hypothetical protein
MMNIVQRLSFSRLAMLLLLSFASAITADSALAAQSAPAESGATKRDGQHDFDFAVGTWDTHVRRLLKPLSGATDWVDGTGTISTRKVWNGRADLEELTMETSAGRLDGLALRLYNPKTHQWRLYWANAKKGVLANPPSFGAFKDGRGEFYDQETFNGKNILLRELFSDITSNSYHFEQAFSADLGKTWEPNLIVDATRTAAAPAAESPSANERNRDFDFNYGHWKVHVSRLEGQLVGSTKWLEYDGLSEVTPVWNGRANLIEVQADGPAGHLEGLGLRLYDPEAQQWNLNWANSRDGMIGTPPTVGGFKDGTGEFLDQELLDGRDIFVRNTYSDTTPKGARFEQAFSPDAGKTWEKNWVITFAPEK